MQGGLVYVSVTMIVSAALYWLVIRPVDRYRRKFGARLPSDAAGAAVPTT